MQQMIDAVSQGHCDNCASDLRDGFVLLDKIYRIPVIVCSPACKFTLAYKWAPRGKRHTWTSVLKYSVASLITLFTFSH